MGRINAPIYSLNGGEVGKEALGRLDLERMQFAFSRCENFLPRVIGSQSIRPGFEYQSDIDYGELQFIEYSYSGSDQVLLILSDQAMRIAINGKILQRPSVTTTIQNGSFNSFVGWTDASTGGASASAVSGDLLLDGAQFSRASAKQTFAITAPNAGVEHGLRVNVTRGPVTIRLGTANGLDDVIQETVLDDGFHSIAFTPSAGNLYLELFHVLNRDVLVSLCSLDPAGDLVLMTPWLASDLGTSPLKYKQVKDVIYVASSVYQQREIQRRGNRSWGIQRYKTEDGPFELYSGDIQLTNSVTAGNGTLTASQSYFKPTMVGRLFRLYHGGQFVPNTFYGAGQEGDYIRVSGVGNDRKFSYSLGGTWSGTVTLQVSTDDGTGNPSGWSDAPAGTGSPFTSNVSSSFTDPDANVIKFYRFVVKTGDYTSGTISSVVEYSGGSRYGICRVTNYVSPTVVGIEIISRFYNRQVGTSQWDFGVWSDHDGWPSASEAFGGRIYWSRGDKVWGSVSDAYKSFSDLVEGDSSAISRSINVQSERGVLWLLGLLCLMAGSDTSEISIKSSSFNEPLTASAWFPVDSSTRGSYNLRAVKTDKDGIFVQSSGIGLFRLTRDNQGDYTSSDLMAMHATICDGSKIVDICVQRRPDTVIWIVLESGECRTLTYEPSENVVAWSRIITDGVITNIACSRGSDQDFLTIAVVRNGVKRLEVLSRTDLCNGGQINCIADSLYKYSGSPQTSFSVPHLEGRQVVVWADGRAVHDQNNLYMVSGGTVSLSTAASNVVIGLPYTAKLRTTKLAYGAQGGTALFQKKKVSQLGLYLIDTVLDGLKVGDSFSSLYRTTVSKGDKPIETGEFFEEYDADLMPLGGDWSTDSRVHIQAQAPYPCTISAMVMDVKTNG